MPKTKKGTSPPKPKKSAVVGKKTIMKKPKKPGLVIKSKTKKPKLIEEIISRSTWTKMTKDEQDAKHLWGQVLGYIVVVNPSEDPNFYDSSNPQFATGTIEDDVKASCHPPKYIKELAQKGTSDVAWDKILNKVPLEPNSKYVLGPYNYYTDSQGRVSFVEGTLQFTKHPDSYRNKYQQGNSVTLKEGVTREFGLYKNADDGGHIIGAQFKGPGQQINYFPQHMTPNEYGQWYVLERCWGEELQKGNNVDVKIALHYPNNYSKRPENVSVVSSITDTKLKVKYDKYSFIDNPVPVKKSDHAPPK